MIKNTYKSLVLLAAVAMLAGCAANGGSAAPTTPPRVPVGWEPSLPDHLMELGSADFQAGGDFPTNIELNNYGCDGPNIRPELHWNNLPAGTESVVVTFTAEGGGPLNRWTLFDVPPTITNIPAGAENPDFGTIGRNSLAGVDMIGPCSHEGETWELWFTVYALDTELGLEAMASELSVRDAGAGHVLAAAELNGYHSYHEE